MVVPELFTLLSFVIAPLVSVAATSPQAVLPSTSNAFTQATSNLVSAAFSNDPQNPYQQGEEEKGPVQIFVFQNEDNKTSYRIYIRNTGRSVAKNIAVGVSHPETAILQSSAPKAHDDITKDGKTEHMWFLPDVPPNTETGITATFNTTANILVGAQVSFSYAGSPRVAGTSNRVLAAVAQAVDENPSAPAATRNPQPAIICDEAETSCSQSIPNLGINFKTVFQLDNRPVICSQVDPRGDCVEKRPILGERFREAVAVVEPGECRVREDARIEEPAFHDAFLRKTEPAAFYMEPLFNSGQDFKALVQQAILDSIRHNLRARTELLSVWTQANQKHLAIIAAVQEGRISGNEAVSQLQIVLEELRTSIRAIQSELRSDYRTIQGRRQARWQPVADKAVQNTRESIIRACFALNGEDEALRLRLEIVRDTVYLPLIESMTTRYTDETEPEFVRVTALQQYWEQVLFPILRNIENAPEASNTYNRARVQELFDELFLSTYIRHGEVDEDVLEAFRLNNWEIELDTPKTKATQCEFQHKVVEVIDAAEETECESGSVAEVLLRNGSDTAKGRLAEGALQPPNVPDNGTTTINLQETLGEACRGLPGDPQWAEGCQCQCGDLIQVSNDPPEFVPCEQLYPITRHDIFVPTAEECAGHSLNPE